MDIGFTISPARPDEWSAAFNLALQQVPDDQRPTRVLNALTLLGAGEVDPQGIFVARDAERIIGVQVCIPLRGASGLFWLPQVDPEWQQSDVADRLVRTALTWLQQGGAKLAQALLHPSAMEHAAPLERSGFRHITRLNYLRRDLDSVPAVPIGPEVRIESFSADNEEVFRQTLSQTYDGTLDCPELNDIRTIDEILEGHRAQGVWRPRTWFLAWQGAQPAAIAMLTELFDHDGWDLSYVGVAPQLRGQGLGRLMTLHAMAVARGFLADSLLVAVDARNEPAAQLYGSLGFAGCDCREVYLQVFSSSEQNTTSRT